MFLPSADSHSATCLALQVPTTVQLGASTSAETLSTHDSVELEQVPTADSQPDISDAGSELELLPAAYSQSRFAGTLIVADVTCIHHWGQELASKVGAKAVVDMLCMQCCCFMYTRHCVALHICSRMGESSVGG